MVARLWHRNVFERNDRVHGASRCKVGPPRAVWKECVIRIKAALKNGARAFRGAAVSLSAVPSSHVFLCCRQPRSQISSHGPLLSLASSFVYSDG